jgi:uncharacterized membrane protein
MSLEGFLISLVGACQAMAGLGVVFWITQNPMLVNRGEHLGLALFVCAVGAAFLYTAHRWDKKSRQIDFSLQAHK